MTTKARAPGVGASATAATWRLVVVAVPLVVVPAGLNPFDTHKAPLLWTAAVVTLAALAVDRARVQAWVAGNATPLWRALVAITAMTVVAMGITNVMSEAPGLAWWGSALRRHGMATELSFAVMIAAGVIFASAGGASRLCTAVVAGSAAPTVIAVLQYAGWSPLAVHFSVDRPTSTFGNPLFLAGYIVVLWPLTLGWIVTVARRQSWRSPGVVAAMALLILQSFVLFATRSAGPLLALAAALGLIAVIVLSGFTSPMIRKVAAVTMLALAIGGAVVSPALLKRALLDDRMRLGETAGVRWMMWDAAARSIESRGGTLALGSGGESSTAAMAAHVSRELGWIEGFDTSPDRIHNASLEALVTYGVVGWLLRFAVAGLVVTIGARALGAAFGIAPIVAVVLSAVILVVTTAIAMWSGGGAWAIAFGPSIALVALMGIALALDRAHARAQWPDPLVPATLCALLVHFLETQVGIPTIASRLAAAAALVMLAGATCDSRSVVAGKRLSLATVAPLVFAAAIAAWFAVRLSTADLLIRSGDLRAEAGDLESATRLYEAAADRLPADAAVQAKLGTAWLDRADAQSSVAARDTAFRQAERAFTSARAIDPYEYHHPRNLAALNRRWARYAAGDRARRLSEADKYYQAATSLAPLNGVLFAEWGNLDAERGQLEMAFDKLDRAAALGALTEARRVSDVLFRLIGGPADDAGRAVTLRQQGRAELARVYVP